MSTWVWELPMWLGEAQCVLMYIIIMLCCLFCNELIVVENSL